MEAAIAKNLLLDHTCDNCEYIIHDSGNSKRCMEGYDHDSRISNLPGIANENTCKWWHSQINEDFETFRKRVEGISE